jgi:hypothetical protein
MSNNHSYLKPWKDGALENLSKLGGWYLFFLFLSGAAGAGYSPVWTNPFVWGLQTRAVVMQFWGDDGP